MCQAGPDYRLGDHHPQIAIIGSCPGMREEEQDRPFVGPAGANLAVMVSIINGISPAKFPSVNRDDYTLLNAHSQPRYNVRGQRPRVRTEPTRNEVLEEANIARLRLHIENTDINRVLLAGKTPRFLFQTIVAVFPEIEVFSCGHPASGAWNTRIVAQDQAEKIRLWTNLTFQMEWPFCVAQQELNPNPNDHRKLRFA